MVQWDARIRMVQWAFGGRSGALKVLERSELHTSAAITGARSVFAVGARWVQWALEVGAVGTRSSGKA